MTVGQTVRVTKRKEGKSSNTIKLNKRPGTIYALDKFKITIEFSKDGHATFRESYNIADIIENIATIEIKVSGEWTKVTREYFK